MKMSTSTILWVGVESCGSIRSLPAVLPPPEEEKDVKSAGEAARAKKSRTDMLEK